MKRSDGAVELVPPGVVTSKSTVPAVPAGAVAVRVVALRYVTVADGVAPKVTTEPATKPEPVTVTTVPPATGPADGAMESTLGTAS